MFALFLKLDVQHTIAVPGVLKSKATDEDKVIELAAMEHESLQQLRSLQEKYGLSDAGLVQGASIVMAWVWVEMKAVLKTLPLRRTQQ